MTYPPPCGDEIYRLRPSFSFFPSPLFLFPLSARAFMGCRSFPFFSDWRGRYRQLSFNIHWDAGVSSLCPSSLFSPLSLPSGGWSERKIHRGPPDALPLFPFFPLLSLFFGPVNSLVNTHKDRLSSINPTLPILRSPFLFCERNDRREAHAVQRATRVSCLFQNSSPLFSPFFLEKRSNRGIAAVAGALQVSTNLSPPPPPTPF